MVSPQHSGSHARSTEPDKSITCNMCGAPIVALSFIRDGDSYCCERCFLKREEYRVAQVEHDGAAYLALAEALAEALDAREHDGAAYLALAEALAEALDAREHETGLHSKRVACHTLVLARRFTKDETLLQQVYWGALLHDIGKIGIPDAVLLKHGALNAEE